MLGEVEKEKFGENDISESEEEEEVTEIIDYTKYNKPESDEDLDKLNFKKYIKN